VFLIFLVFCFLAIFQVLSCAFSIFHLFQVCSPFSSSYSVHFAFSKFFSVVAIFQVL
jgi:hypothetical protein